MNIRTLRQSNFRVLVRHERLVKIPQMTEPVLMPICAVKACKWGNYVLPKGGITKLWITTPQKEQINVEANCAVTDNFVYKRGVEIALNRLNLKLF